MNNQLIIWGAGGHGKVVLDIARNVETFERIVFLDDDLSKAGSSFCDCPLIGGPEKLYLLKERAFIIAIGDNRTRAGCFYRMSRNGLIPTTLIHGSAIVAPSARIGAGSVVMPRVVINADAVIGENCIVNTGAVIEHDCDVGAHTHISPLAVLGGGVSVGAFAHVGIGAAVLPGAIIGEESIVGGGALVVREAPARCTVVGVPAKSIVRSENVAYSPLCSPHEPNGR